MAKRPTIKDIAREAGVSVATVNRVLGGHLGVREDTRRKVAAAARRIGYHSANLIDQRLRPDLPEIRFGFVLHKEHQPFYQAFANEIETQVRLLSDVRATATIRFAPGQAPDDFATTLDALGSEVDALAATAVNHAAVTQVAERLDGAGVPVFAMLTDFAQGVRRGYVGLDNHKVGRGAAKMLALAARRPGKLALFLGGHRFHGHEMREIGFRSMLRELPGEFTLLDPLVNLETRLLTKEATIDLLARHGDLRGIYIAGGGMEGAIAALRAERNPGDVPLIVNELTPDSQMGLVDGYVTMVVATPLSSLVKSLLELMVTAHLHPTAPVASPLFIQPQSIYPNSSEFHVRSRRISPIRARRGNQRNGLRST